MVCVLDGSLSERLLGVGAVSFSPGYRGLISDTLNSSVKLECITSFPRFQQVSSLKYFLLSTLEWEVFKWGEVRKTAESAAGTPN